MRDDRADLHGLDLPGHEGAALHVPVLGNVSVDQVGGEALHGIVALELPQVVAKTLHGEVGPVRVLDAVAVAVVLNDSEAVLESLGVKEGVQRIPGGAQNTVAALGNTRVLLTSEVL